MTYRIDMADEDSAQFDHSKRSRDWAATMAGHLTSDIRLAHADSWAGPGTTEIADRFAREDADAGILAPLATHATGSGTRAIDEQPDEYRTCFERDRDRILHASAETPDVIARIIANESKVGTWFLPHDRQLSARKLWIAFAAEVEGSVVVDAGACEALISRGTSLLPAGVVSVVGNFVAGATIEICDEASRVVARGMAAMSSLEIEQSQGKRSSDIGSNVSIEVVHRDDLVILQL